VKAYDDELFETTLVNGSVMVAGKNGHQVNLTPGTQVVFDAEKYIKRDLLKLNCLPRGKTASLFSGILRFVL
jgi:hypothetical protein